MATDPPLLPGKSLTVYYSLGGHTARVARDIAKMTEGDIESLQDVEHGAGPFGYLKAMVDALRRKPAPLGNLAHDPGKYPLVIIGTPVWAGQMTPAVRAYLQRFRDDLPHVAFFVTSGSTDAREVVPSMEWVLGHRAEAFTGFNARELEDPHQYHAKLAAFVQELQQPSGDGTAVAGAARPDFARAEQRVGN